MSETPKKVRCDVDNTINRLNNDWDLQLTHLHGRSAEAAENTSALAKRCSSRIRYLCWRLPNLDGILEDFYERAFQIKSSWVYKPRQERGTLPILPVIKSNLKRDVTRGRTLGLAKLDAKQRQQLLAALDEALKDDYELSRQSDSFSRTSSMSALSEKDKLQPFKQTRVEGVKSKSVAEGASSRRLRMRLIDVAGLDAPETRAPSIFDSAASVAGPTGRPKRSSSGSKTPVSQTVGTDTRMSAKRKSDNAGQDEVSFVSCGQMSDVLIRFRSRNRRRLSKR